jgi:hypothetical protein
VRSCPGGAATATRRSHVVAIALVLTAGGCGGDGALDGAGYVERDSAGITIVESTEPAWGPGRGWRISLEPRLSIGTTEGPEEYQLFRAQTALRMSDGRILVANAGTYELRFYDARGRFIATTGRQGEGPGEFRSMSATWRTEADSVVVYDWRLGRFSVFDAGGVFARSFRLAGAAGEFALPNALFGDGTVLASVDDQDQGEYTQLGVVRGRARYNRYDRDGRLIDTLVTLPGAELYKGTHPDGSGYTTSADHAVRPFAAAAQSAWFYGSADALEFQARRMDGTLLRLARLDRTRRAMPVEVRAARDAWLREASPQTRDFWGRVPLPDSLPTHGRLVIDRTGNLWAQGYTVLDEGEFWYVFDPRGRWLGEVKPPAKLRITEIGEDYLLGVMADSLGVERVMVFDLQRGDRFR